jgi:hypothetical protein
MEEQGKGGEGKILGLRNIVFKEGNEWGPYESIKDLWMRGVMLEQKKLPRSL